MKKDVGINNRRIILSLLLWLLSIALILTCLLMWWDYGSQSTYKYYNENAIEVKAIIVSYNYDYSTSDKNTKNWVTRYEYKSEWGTIYQGRYAVHTDESTAIEEVGKSVIIYIDPSSDWSGKHLPSFNYGKALKKSIIFSLPIPLLLYLLIYRCIYRDLLNKKIRKKLYGKYYKNDRFALVSLPDIIREGEVIKVRKWIVCYVKVKYQDDHNGTQEKWARAWFTHREAKFLKQKKFINIVPYKKTYGILEEMSYKS